MLKNPLETKNKIVQWIRDYMDENGSGCTAVIGCSGGKDSTVAAALCAEALGKDRVLGVLMPNGIQSDIADAYHVCQLLGIRYVVVNIGEIYESFRSQLSNGICEYMTRTANNIQITDQCKINLPPRIRMSTLYAVAQCLPEGGRVVNTCNRSEDYVGYSTKFGDSAGDFSPLSDLLVHEVKQIGHCWAKLNELVDKPPADGLCGKTDEDNLGFTYNYLDHFIMQDGIADDEELNQKIRRLNKANLHKLRPMPYYFLSGEEVE